jgi:nitroreductase
MTVVAAAAARRRSRSKVTDDAPSHEQLLAAVEAAATVADHSSLRPWRLIELRGDDRRLIGRSLAAADGAEGRDAEKLEQKSLRAPLVLAVVSSPQPSRKVPEWEQESVASGVAHLLSLVLDDEGWGVFWRSGTHTRAPEVHAAHGLTGDEKLLGWLYVGGRDRPRDDEKPRKRVDASRHLSGPPRP